MLGVALGLAYSLLAQSSPELRVLTYSSLVGKNSFLELAQPLLEKKCNVRLRILSLGDGGQLLMRWREQDHELNADLVIGLDQFQWERAKDLVYQWESQGQNSQDKWRPKNISALNLPSQARVTGFLPFDQSAMTFLVNKKKLNEMSSPSINHLPRSLSDFKDPKYAKLFAIQDPRTSTPGMLLVLLTWVKFGQSEFKNFWKQTRKNFSFITLSWDQSYAAFLSGSVSFVWSYVTSQAYHFSKKESPSHFLVQALDLNEGAPLQIEAAVITKRATQDPLRLKKSQCVLESLIDSEVQSLIPQTQWMFPVRSDVQLPKSFLDLKPLKTFWLPVLPPSELEKMIRLWREALE